ncbi:hypothetical protein F5883DRAFT_438748 [Diaporthe sp. PMI_573]|nr:hypothetical protein F5883DRAFT_438748 [Diaporthaceae sp. PMI_573]
MFSLASLFLPLGLVAFVSAQDQTLSACTPSQTLTTFSWFNSSHNLDCLNRNWPSDAVWCYNVTDTGSVERSCFSLCGGPLILDETAPLGFGPPDRLTSNLCSYQSPPGNMIHFTEIGNGALYCGAGSYPPGEFVGDSNQDEGANGTFRFAPAIQCADENGDAVYPVYQAEFPLHCTRDAENNATCTTDLPVVLPLTG